MKREHTYFGIFLSLLLLAPRIPLHLIGGAFGSMPSESSLSLRIVGLIFLILWSLALRPRPSWSYKTTSLQGNVRDNGKGIAMYWHNDRRDSRIVAARGPGATK